MSRQPYLRLPEICLLLLVSTIALRQTLAIDLQSSSVLSATNSFHRSSRALHPRWGRKINSLCHKSRSSIESGTRCLLLEDSLRGGAAGDESETENSESDTEEEEVVVEEEKESEDESETEDEAEEESEVEEDSGNDAIATTSDYDAPLVANPMIQMYLIFGIMMFSKRLDLYDPKVVRMARFAFLGFLVLQQGFVLYVRLRAKINNDRTPVSVSNPLTNMLQSQLQGQDGSNAMMKNLASSFLSSESTVMEYDLKQAKNMQGGVLFNMVFMWFLHFKLEQIQPLLMQTVTGLVNLFYNPLFQVYVMGRNLERPFKNPAMQKMEESRAELEEEAPAIDATTDSKTKDDTTAATKEEEQKDDSNEDEDESDEFDSEDGDEDEDEDDE